MLLIEFINNLDESQPAKWRKPAFCARAGKQV
jgi:hypothetical protein